jgi:hypothetical protein
MKTLLKLLEKEQERNIHNIFYRLKTLAAVLECNLPSLFLHSNHFI